MTDVDGNLAMKPPARPSGRGTDPALCGGTRRDGLRCVKPAGWGTEHKGVGRCRLHGGNTPTHRMAGARQLAEKGARQIVASLGQPVPVHNPTKRLLEVLGEMDLFVKACKVQLDDLDEWVALDNFGAEQAKAIVRLYVEVISMFEKALVDAARLKLEERLVAIDEATADLVLVVVERALKVAVPAEFHDRFKAAFAVEAQAREVTG